MLKRNLLLLAGVIALAAVPLVLYRPSEDKEVFAGADGQAQDVIGEVKPEYEPWYRNFWEPPSGEIESMLFSLQAAIGAGLVFYCIGYYGGRHAERNRKTPDASG